MDKPGDRIRAESALLALVYLIAVGVVVELILRKVTLTHRAQHCRSSCLPDVTVIKDITDASQRLSQSRVGQHLEVLEDGLVDSRATS